jgi:eukaryotic-like serine/threonine-protein kinase
MAIAARCILASGTRLRLGGSRGAAALPSTGLGSACAPSDLTVPRKFPSRLRVVYAPHRRCIEIRAIASGQDLGLSYLSIRLTALQSSSPVRALGRYMLFGEIASGGMASVHFGRLSGVAGFSRMVAIKRLHANLAKDPTFVTMFLDEARLAARIRHPNVVPTLDMVATEGEIFLVMEYVHGQSLAKLWRALRKANRQADPRVVAAVMSGVLHGLHAAHEATGERGESLDIVHRDVSPQNILVGADGVSRVLDFGIAKAAGRMQTTREGRIKGKIAYMPPEQLHDAILTRQTDVYAAAVVTWEMLTGRRAFDGQHEAAVIAAILADPLLPPSKLASRVPTAFDGVVMRGLARNPARRYATARDMALDLERCAGIASMSEVSDWVNLYAHDELARRTRRMAAIEVVSPVRRAPRPSRPAASELPTRPSLSGRQSGFVEGSSGVSRVALSPTISRLMRRSRERVVTTSVAFVGLLTVIQLVRGVSCGAAPAAPPASAHSASAVVRAPPALQNAPPLATAPTPAAPTFAMPVPVALVPTAPAIAVSDWKPAPPRPQRVVAAAVRPLPKSAKRDCDPPFAVDDKGHKHFKAACLE